MVRRPLPQSHNDLAKILDLSNEQLFYHRRVASRSYRKKRLKANRLLRIPDLRTRALQRTLLKEVRALLPVSVAAMGAPGRGAVSHAREHRGFGWCFACDVHSCFPSVSRQVVARALLMAGLGEEAAEALCDIATTDDQLPQGAPTSGWLLDVVFRRTDDAMLAKCAVSAARYSRYFDDIAISATSERPALVRGLESRIHELALRLNDTKTHSALAPERIIITGVEVSTEIRPSPVFVEALIDAIAEFALGSETVCRAELEGRLSWVSQVNPTLAAKLRRKLPRRS